MYLLKYLLIFNFADENFNMFDMTNNPFMMIGLFSYISTIMVEKTFNNTNFKKLMQSGEKYDAVILEEFNSEALKYVAHHFNAPLIVYNAMDANEWINPYQGNPDSPSYVPLVYLPYTSDMSFFERVYNSIIYVYINLVRHIFFLPMQNRVLHKYYPNAPNLDQFIYNVSLVLLNADESVYDALPRVPSMKNIGGFHIHQPKPLPNDLQQLLDNAEHGVIYFSMGSNLLAKDMPTEKKKILLRTLSKLKQTVLWKYEEENLPGKPENVITRKWLPQNDILAHKNIKLFITHGGIFSTYEAVYHGVPLLSLGVISEQILNGKRSEKNGYAKAVPFFDIEEETLDLYLKELLENPKYKENAARRSRILKDKPQSATAAVNYWVEYVVRHKGASHLRVASLDLTWYQCMLLDVVAFLLVSFVVLIYTLKFLFRTVFGRKVNKKEKTA
ncbi:hypothetical protein WA026_005930 [Henosepilachna vigintioctopunctata]|uniref:UDP-glucuronosyltransferase n=1 Tax=Henosepilachna vigintioctopunctata TaxID=420089 RepID=A0AAW1TXY9_9CUCU